MLILTRRPDESIHIGDNVVVRVLGVVGNNVRIGIDAPRNIPVHREEIYERAKNEKKDPNGDADGNVALPEPE